MDLITFSFTKRDRYGGKIFHVKVFIILLSQEDYGDIGHETIMDVYLYDSDFPFYRITGPTYCRHLGPDVEVGGGCRKDPVIILSLCND